MNDSNAIEADTFKSSYSVKQIGTAIAFAFLLHGAILAGYFIMGSEKKGPGKTAEKSDKKEDAKAAVAPAKPGDAPKTDAGDKPADTASKTPVTPPPDAKKNTETAKPGEIPAAPDSDIDNILKAK